MRDFLQVKGGRHGPVVNTPVVKSVLLVTSINQFINMLVARGPDSSEIQQLK